MVFAVGVIVGAVSGLLVCSTAFIVILLVGILMAIGLSPRRGTGLQLREWVAALIKQDGEACQNSVTGGCPRRG